MGATQDENNVQNNNDTSTRFDKKYIDESLRKYAHILHDCLIVLEKECLTKEKKNKMNLKK